MRGLSLGLGLGARGVGGGTPTPSAPFTSVNANGWSVDYATSPPSLNPLTPFPVGRTGYDVNGAVVPVVDIMTVTQWVRNPFPAQGSLSPKTAAISDTIVVGDTISGRTNDSTEVMPKVIGNWGMLSRLLVGDDITVETTGNHWAARNKAPFACAEYTVSDGTTSATARQASITVSGHVGDKFAVQSYESTVNIAPLATGLIYTDGDLKPWVGGSGAINSTTANGTAPREFTRRYFYKDTARFNAPPLAYVASTGNNGTGVVSTTAATASATPFLTVQGAIDGLLAATGVTGGYVDGCRIRIMDTVTHGASAAVAKAQRCAAVIIERDPNVSKAAAIVQLSATWRPRLGVGTLLGGLTEGAILYRDVTVQRTGAFTWTGEAANQLNVMFADDVAFDNGGFNAALISNAHLWIDGAIFTNATGLSVLNAGALEIRMTRGLSVDRNGAATEGFLVLGCDFTRPGNINTGARSQSNSIIQFNRFTNPGSSVALVDVGASADVTNFSFSGNLVEICHTTTSTPGLRASSDNGTGNLTHCLFDNNTVTGVYQVGRFNFCYDETAATGRTHRFCRNRNPVLPAIYNKGDVFLLNGARVGNWAQMYASGSKNLYVLYANPGVNTIGATEGLAYPGLGSIFGTSNTAPVAPLASLFSNYQGTTTSGTTPVAGAGGGTYTPAASSPLIGIASTFDEVFPFDLAGVARTRGTVGAYA